MTPQETVKWLKAIEEKYIHGGDDYFDEKRKAAINIAINALEKQIPKKPVKKKPICYAKTKNGQEIYAYDYHCLMCNAKLKAKEHHCTCGQEIDWSDAK